VGRVCPSALTCRPRSLVYLQAIQDARSHKEWSQKELAQKVNEKPSVIQDYESSKAIPNAQILGKLERALGVKLRGEQLYFLIARVV
jgi:ribosome-binding protein aMBF1 (putative translation factor)